MHRQYVHAEGRTIAYLDSAPSGSDLKCLVFVHAFPLAATLWEPQLRRVPEGWRFVAIDLRGFGGSTDADHSSPSIDDYADDVSALAAELGLSSIVLAGLSMGGYTSLAVLRRTPSLVRAVVLADTRAGADSPEGRANRRAMMAVVEREGADGVARDMMPKMVSDHTRANRPDVESNIRRLIRQQSPQAIRGAILRMMSRPDSTGLLPAIRVPALVIVGADDALTPVADSRQMADAIPSAHLEIVPHAGHLSNVEQPDAFNAALHAFLSRL